MAKIQFKDLGNATFLTLNHLCHKFGLLPRKILKINKQTHKQIFQTLEGSYV